MEALKSRGARSILCAAIFLLLNSIAAAIQIKPIEDPATGNKYYGWHIVSANTKATKLKIQVPQTIPLATINIELYVANLETDITTLHPTIIRPNLNQEGTFILPSEASALITIPAQEGTQSPENAELTIVSDTTGRKIENNIIDLLVPPQLEDNNPASAEEKMTYAELVKNTEEREALIIAADKLAKEQEAKERLAQEQLAAKQKRKSELATNLTTLETKHKNLVKQQEEHATKSQKYIKQRNNEIPNQEAHKKIVERCRDEVARVYQQCVEEILELYSLENVERSQKFQEEDEALRKEEEEIKEALDTNEAERQQALQELTALEAELTAAVPPLPEASSAETTTTQYVVELDLNIGNCWGLFNRRHATLYDEAATAQEEVTLSSFAKD